MAEKAILGFQKNLFLVIWVAEWKFFGNIFMKKLLKFTKKTICIVSCIQNTYLFVLKISIDEDHPYNLNLLTLNHKHDVVPNILAYHGK